MFASLILFALSLLATAADQNPSQPAPLGKLIDVGGYRVHLYCTGQGSPTIIVTGMEFSFDWALVQPEVAKFVRICTYDPSSTAWSDRGPALTCDARVNEIHKMLENAEIAPPYVLVGLSMGAVVARLYASRYPTQVSGMVFVDHAFLDAGPADQASKPSEPVGDSPPLLIYKEPIRMTIEENPSFGRLPKHDRELHHWAASLNPEVPTVKEAEECIFGGGFSNPHENLAAGANAACRHQHSQSSRELRQAAEEASVSIE